MIMELKNIWFTRGTETIIKDVTLSIREGEIIVVRGRSGVGKTTLARIAALLLEPSAGKIFFMNNDVTSLGDHSKSKLRLKYIGYVDQFHKLLPNLTVIDNVVLPLRLMGYKKQEAYREAIEILKALDIHHIKDKYPNEISGGQKQRVAIARALAKKPILFVGDEPFSNLDDETMNLVFDILLKHAKEKNMAALITTTDLYTKYPSHTEYQLNQGTLYEKR